jgi:predicted MFS family arabinose efflux permease
LVVFPFGPQAARLWHPGISGFAVLTAAFPFAAVVGGLLASRAPRLPGTPRNLALLAFVASLPCVLTFDYMSLVVARFIAGLATGVSYVAIHRALSPATGPFIARLTPCIISFGMPVCLLAATVFDWRFAFIPLLTGHALVALLPTQRSELLAPGLKLLPEATPAAPAALVATGALAFVSAAYLTVLSGFLVFNAGHTEFHIPLVLILASLLGLAVPSVLASLRRRLSAAAVFASALGFSATNLLALLTLRGPQPAALAVSLTALFLVTSSARHLALAGLVLPRLAPGQLPAHQIHNHLAHHLGSGLGALSAGLLVSLTPAHTLAGMPALLATSLVATILALASGLLSTRPNRASVTIETAAPGLVADNRR